MDSSVMGLSFGIKLWLSFSGIEHFGIILFLTDSYSYLMGWGKKYLDRKKPPHTQNV